MPIFEKNGKRIYFAHIPKTAGIAVYCAFVESGWAISNLTERSHPHSASSLLSSRYHIGEIPQVGRSYGYKHSLQHAPAILYERWGPFDEVFAIVREPFDRFLSSMRYRFKHLAPPVEFEEYVFQVVSQVKTKPLYLYTEFDGHLIPQHWFLSRKTMVLRYESNWQEFLISHYGLKKDSLRRENYSQAYSFDLLSSNSLASWIQKIYRRDSRIISALDRL